MRRPPSAPEILNQIVARDTRDATRSVGPLAVPPGATVIDTTTLTQEQVVAKIVERVRGEKAEEVRDEGTEGQRD